MWLLAAVLVYCTSRSKSNRDGNKCYRNQCCSKIFHIPPFKRDVVDVVQRELNRRGKNWNCSLKVRGKQMIWQFYETRTL